MYVKFNRFKVFPIVWKLLYTSIISMSKALPSEHYDDGDIGNDGEDGEDGDNEAIDRFDEGERSQPGGGIHCVAGVTHQALAGIHCVRPI